LLGAVSFLKEGAFRISLSLDESIKCLFSDADKALSVLEKEN
jgi:hypothetical protein